MQRRGCAMKHCAWDNFISHLFLTRQCAAFPSMMGLLAYITLSLMSPILAVGQSATTASHPLEPSAYRGSLRSVLLPREDIKLSAASAGIIKNYHIEEGQRVKAGEVILELDAREENAAVNHAQALLEGAAAELERARKDMVRVEKLFKDNIQSERQYEETVYLLAKAESLYKQTQATLETAMIRRENKKIKSPIDGLFLKKYKSVGESVERLQTVARVLDELRLELVVYCGSHLFGALHADTTLQIEILDGPSRGEQASAEVVYVDPLIDPSSGTFRVKLEIAPTDSVSAGLAARLLISNLDTPEE